ncbi:aminoglycoside phosphotransferase family protein [Hymenobacter lutimineralis]|uniref:Aminoglycoside phosphotransferase family protein n=1 Tax=Hymenobacter lutimineralis TaxID=2606448 RepID=A0A5D6UY43_9BACT|nr:aminoglycoside phosphotransferase family protein [Hymenobacter lutimineralis]TYZ07419.1 aminoglycoside phosphotransferase family protein [Hymenobacter lutimineralis]
MKTADYFAPAYLERLLRTTLPSAQVLAVEPFALDNSASILAVLTAGQSERPIGHYGLRVRYSSPAGEQTENLVLKLKPPGAEISAMLQSLATACGGELGAVYPAHMLQTGFANTHHRELTVYAQPQAGLMPRIRGLHQDEATGVYAILMEHLGEDLQLMNSVMHPEQWTDAHLRAALSQLAEWHAGHLLPAGAPPPWADAPTLDYMLAQRPLWQALLNNAASHLPELYLSSRTAQLQAALDALPAYWPELAAAPHTLVHNDLNPRNTCFRQTDEGLQLCAYDWELATYHVPVYDVVELLCFVLTPERYAQRLDYLEFYRQQLHARTQQFADADHFRRITGLAAFDFGLHRLGMYLMAHTVSPYPFLPRVVDSYFDTLTQLRPWLPELASCS